jgi:hypothetical protein
MNIDAIITARDAATEIVSQMSSDDRAAFTPEAWRDGVSAMLDGDWAHLDLDEVLDAMVEIGRAA